MTKELLWFSSNVASLSYVSAGGFASVIIFDSFGGDIAVVVIRKKSLAQPNPRARWALATHKSYWTGLGQRFRYLEKNFLARA
jgi:hypothetical protein